MFVDRRTEHRFLDYLRSSIRRGPRYLDRAQYPSRRLHPPLAALGKDGLEVAFKQGAGVLEVLFGVGFGGGDAVKRFVEDADDPLLFGERGNGMASFDLCRRFVESRRALSTLQHHRSMNCRERAVERTSYEARWSPSVDRYEPTAECVRCTR